MLYLTMASVFAILAICDRICEKGPFRGNVNMWVQEKTRKIAISRDRGLLHHQDLWCIPYLLAKFETRTTFLRLKRGPNSFTPWLSCSCIDYTGNGTRTVYGNVYGDIREDPPLSVFIAL